MWLAATNGNSKQKKGEASCTCSDPRGSSTMVKQGTADASQKPIDPSSLSITEALAGTLVATVFQFVQLNTVTPKVLNEAVALMYERTGIAQIKGTSRAPPPPPPDDSNITTAATAQEIWTVYKEMIGSAGRTRRCCARCRRWLLPAVARPSSMTVPMRVPVPMR